MSQESMGPFTSDWVQAYGNVAQAILTLLTAFATFIIAWYAHHVSKAQIRPFLNLETENGRLHTVIILLNNGLGPATITKVTYTLHGQKARIDAMEGNLRNQKTLTSAVAACFDEKGEPAGRRVYFFRHREVHEYDRNDLTREELKEVLDTSSQGKNVEQSMVAGQVLKAGGEIVLLLATVIDDNEGPAKQWLRLLRKKVNGAVIEVEYTDARGSKVKPKYVSIVRMPATQPANGGAADDGSSTASFKTCSSGASSNAAAGSETAAPPLSAAPAAKPTSFVAVDMLSEQLQVPAPVPDAMRGRTTDQS